MATEFDLSMFGGTQTGTGASKEWNFGWTPANQLPPEQQALRAAHFAKFANALPDRRAQVQDGSARLFAEMPRIMSGVAAVLGTRSVFGASTLPMFSDATRTFLWDYVRPWNPDLLYVRQITGSCFPAGAPVRMGDGTERAIEDVRIGETVIDHTGTPRKVVRTFNRKYTGDLYTYQASGTGFEISLTADHKVRVVRPQEGWRSRTGPEWVRADELTTEDRVLVQHHRKEVDPVLEIDAAGVIGPAAVDMDALMAGDDGPYRRARAIRKAIREKGTAFAGTVRLKKARHEGGITRRIAVTPTFGRLLGIYLAEGGVDSGRVTFTFNADECGTLAAETVTLLRGVFGVESEVTVEADLGRSTVRVDNFTLAAFLTALVPGKVRTKRVPGFVFSAGEALRKAVVGGWMAGDGYYAEKPRKGRKKVGLRIQGVTASPGLARDMTVLGLACGYHVSTNRRPPRKRSAEAFDVYLGGPDASRDIATAKGLQPQVLTRGRTDVNRTEHGYARRIRSIDSRPVENLTVYCLEVEEGHSFLVNDIVHHNCVGAGGGSMMITRQGIDTYLLGQQEQPVFPFWLIAYGKSREYLGLNDRGEGSSGSTFKRAMETDGFLSAGDAAVAQFPYTTTDNLSWGREAELTFSQGRKIDPALLTTSRKHTAGLAKVVTSFDELVEHIHVHKRPATNASNIGFRMTARTGGSRFPVLINEYADTWNHQTSFQGYWRHPELGELVYYLNQWGRQTHGRPLQGEPPGGFWINKKDATRIINQKETIVYDSLIGIEADTVDWGTI